MSLSISVIGVDRIAPVIRRSAWFWTLSRACWLVFAVVDHAVEPYSRWGLACFPGDTSKFVKNSRQPASGFCFCLGNMRFPGLPVVKCNTKVCCFLILLQRSPTKSDGANFLLWGQGEQGGGRLVLVDYNTPFLSPAVELVSCQLHPVCGCSCVFFLHHITKISAYNAVLMPLGSSDTRSWMESRKFALIACNMCATWYSACLVNSKSKQNAKCICSENFT